MAYSYGSNLLEQFFFVWINGELKFLKQGQNFWNSRKPFLRSFRAHLVTMTSFVTNEGNSYNGR